MGFSLYNESPKIFRKQGGNKMNNIGKQFEDVFMLSRISDLFPENAVKCNKLQPKLEDIFSKTEFGTFDAFVTSSFARTAFKNMKAENLDRILIMHCEDAALPETYYHSVGLYDNHHESMLSLDLAPHSAVIMLQTGNEELSLVSDTNSGYISFETKDIASGKTTGTNFIECDGEVLVSDYESNENEIATNPFN